MSVRTHKESYEYGNVGEIRFGRDVGREELSVVRRGGVRSGGQGDRRMLFE
jgi:hypothetical protein